MRHNVLSKIFYLLLVFFVSSSLGYDEVIPDRNAPINHRPEIAPSYKNNTIVNIAAPNENGISFNEYLRFDIPKDGVVLNNSSRKTRTSNGELIRGNGNLVNGAADLIVNKINSNRPSFLNGNLEIAGTKADLIIANPSGITIDGLNVINARSTTITTANPVFDGRNINALELTNQSKSVNIVGAGLYDMQSDYTKIIANVIKINADIWAKHIKLNAGVADKKEQAREINEPIVTIDSSHIGGMFKGAIVLIGNEDGVGSNNKQFIHADKFSIQAKVRVKTTDTSNLNDHSDTIIDHSTPEFNLLRRGSSYCQNCHAGGGKGGGAGVGAGKGGGAGGGGAGGGKGGGAGAGKGGGTGTGAGTGGGGSGNSGGSNIISGGWQGGQAGAISGGAGGTGRIIGGGQAGAISGGAGGAGRIIGGGHTGGSPIGGGNIPGFNPSLGGAAGAVGSTIIYNINHQKIGEAQKAKNDHDGGITIDGKFYPKDKDNKGNAVVIKEPLSESKIRDYTEELIGRKLPDPRIIDENGEKKEIYTVEDGDITINLRNKSKSKLQDGEKADWTIDIIIRDKQGRKTEEVEIKFRKGD